MTTPAANPVDVERMRLELYMQVVKTNESIIRSNELLLQTLAKPVDNQSTNKIADVLNIIGDNNVLSQARNSVVTISSQQFTGLSREMDSAIQTFVSAINKQLILNNVPTEHIAEISKSIVDLGKESEGVDPTKVKGVKKAGIKAKLMTVGECLCKNLPKTAETIALFTPLAPFAHLIGETLDDLMKEVQEEC